MEHFQELLVVAARVGQEIVERERHWRDAQRVGAGLDLRDLAVVLGAVNGDRKSTRLNSSHLVISYAVFCLKKKKTDHRSRYLHNSLVPAHATHTALYDRTR